MDKINDILKRIIDFADQAHGEQMRKYTNERYIVHPVRVMEICKEYTTDISVLSAALLHDVLEDTPVQKEEIMAFLISFMTEKEARKTIDLVVDLTDVYIKELYPQWNRNKRKQLECERMAMIAPESQSVKYADIIDNCIDIVKHDRGFAPRFINECGKLLKVMKKGDERLYKRAVETLEECRRKLK